jgi:hypothetical protein
VETRAPIFIRYTHKDSQWLVKLRSALCPLEQRAQLAVWDDRQLQPGALFNQDIREAIARAPVAILLVSSAFFACIFIQQEEQPAAVATGGW